MPPEKQAGQGPPRPRAVPERLRLGHGHLGLSDRRRGQRRRPRPVDLGYFFPHRGQDRRRQQWRPRQRALSPLQGRRPPDQGSRRKGVSLLHRLAAGFPEGSGKPNPKGLDFYNRLIDELLANGIVPYATLYHWDLPQALQDRVGGWQSSETSKAFAEYSGYVAERLSDRVKYFFTLNEAGRFLNFGYGWGIDAPGLKLPTAELNQARHHVVLGHGLAVQAIRARARKAPWSARPKTSPPACRPSRRRSISAPPRWRRAN